jgi:hypothetical protein
MIETPCVATALPGPRARASDTTSGPASPPTSVPEMRLLVVLTASAACVALASAAPIAAAASSREQAEGAPATSELLLDPEERRVQEAHGTWSDMFSEDGVATRLPVPVLGARARRRRADRPSLRLARGGFASGAVAPRCSRER